MHTHTVTQQHYASPGQPDFSEPSADTAQIALGAPGQANSEEASMELLRELLFGDYRQQVARMRAEVSSLQSLLDELEVQINNKEALVATITPVIASAIRTNIRDSQSEMVDALYPILGKLVQRSVTESMRELAQRIDRQMRRTFNMKDMIRRMAGRLQGLSEAEMTLRDALPFQIHNLFLIHRDSSLLLLHTAHVAQENADSDLISSMLSAIRDFTEDALGRSEKEELNQIQYGGKSIIIEVAHHVYLAATIEGIEPQGFREQMRQTMIEIEHQHANLLHKYDGNAAPFAPSTMTLAALLRYAEGHQAANH